MPLAAYHLEGEAQLWYQLLKEEEEHITWEILKEGLHVRYGPMKTSLGTLQSSSKQALLENIRVSFRSCSAEH